MNKYQAVIFDLDGTLADSLADIADAMNRTLQHHGFPVHDHNAYKYFVGKGLKNLTIETLPEDNRDDETIENCFNYLMTNYRQNYLVKTKLYDGIAGLLDWLTENGLRMAILSNKADEIVRPICRELLNDWSFDVILGVSEQFPRKPAPDAALHIAKKWGISTQHILYLGDSGIDMQTARAAGMEAVGVTWGFRTEQELRENGAHRIIHSPMQLSNHIYF